MNKLIGLKIYRSINYGKRAGKNTVRAIWIILQHRFKVEIEWFRITDIDEHGTFNVYFCFKDNSFGEINISSEIINRIILLLIKNDKLLKEETLKYFNKEK